MSVAYIKDFLWGRFDTEEDEGEEKMGWKDDAKQLDLPRCYQFAMVLDWFNYYYLNLGRVAALTSNDEPDLYDNIAHSFNKLKETVNDVVSRPEVKDNMFYILMGKYQCSD